MDRRFKVMMQKPPPFPPSLEWLGKSNVTQEENWKKKEGHDGNSTRLRMMKASLGKSTTQLLLVPPCSRVGRPALVVVAAEIPTHTHTH